jgi:hypothetical protein
VTTDSAFSTSWALPAGWEAWLIVFGVVALLLCIRWRRVLLRLAPAISLVMTALLVVCLVLSWNDLKSLSFGTSFLEPHEDPWTWDVSLDAERGGIRLAQRTVAYTPQSDQPLWQPAHVHFYRESFAVNYPNGTPEKKRTWPFVQGRLGFDVYWTIWRPPLGTNSYIAHRGIIVPQWSLIVLTLILPSVRFRRFLRRRYRVRHGLCLSCGYDLRGSVGKCPECGGAIVRAKEAGGVGTPVGEG